MDKEKPLGLPPTGRTPRPPSPSPSPSSQPETASYSNDLSRMPENPPKSSGHHRRAHSEIITLSDDITFAGELCIVAGDCDGPSFSDDTEEDLISMYIDMEKVNSGATSEFEFGDASWAAVRGRHKYSQSMDGSSSMNTEMFNEGGGVSAAEAKKAMSAAKLAELALIDPKRAKRIWANRQSAQRSKERKVRYIAELERKVQTLQTEATSLSAQFNLLQRDTNGLTSENSELKIRLQAMEQQVHLQDALNDALKEEIQHLKMLTGQAMSNGGPMMNFPASFAPNQQFYPNNQAMHNTLRTANQFQQLQLHSQKQQQQFQHHQLQQQQIQHQNPALRNHIRPPMPPPSKENSSDSKPSPS